ncbi:hypothetical protein V3C99_005751 [Haemonchus contortus]
MLLKLLYLLFVCFSITNSQYDNHNVSKKMTYATIPMEAGDTTTSTQYTQVSSVTTKAPTCASKASYYPIYNGWNTQAGQCSLSGKASSNCEYWRIIVVILLNNDWSSSAEDLLDIQSFINGVTKGCDSRSTLQVFDNGRTISNINCPEAKMMTNQEQTLMGNLSISGTFPLPGTPTGDQLGLLLEQAYSCANDYPMDDREAGVVFVFTNIPCEELCQSEQLQTDAQPLTQIFTSNLRYVVKYMFLSDDISQKACTRALFSTCAKMDPSLCDVSIYGSQSRSLTNTISSSMTCVASMNSSPPGLSTAELIVVIAVPCFCMTVICVACAVACYKRAKYTAQQWRRFWQTHSEHTHEDTTMTYSLSHLPHPGSLVMASHYMDVRILAEANRKDNWEVSLSNLTIHENEILGNGAFAVVHKATLRGKIPLLVINPRLNLVSEHEQDNGTTEAAVKRLPAHANDQNRIDFFHEISFMKNLGYHPHVISMLGCISCTDTPMILVEYCEHGDLLRFLRKHRDFILMHENDECPIDAELCLRIKDLVSISWQVSDGLAYLSSKNFIHRDVAARNVLLTKHLVAKVSDFGLGRYADSALYTARGGRLPFKSMALEALKYYEFSEKTDVWAFAILLFEIFSLGSVPYPTVQPVDMISYIEQGNRPPQPEKCPNEIFKLMKRCWQADPNDRPTFAEIRGELTILLNIDDESYGYLNLDDKKSRQIRDMINRQITELHTPNDGESNALERQEDADKSTVLEDIVMGLSQTNDSAFTETDGQKTKCPLQHDDDVIPGSEPLFTTICEGISDGPPILPSSYVLPSYSHLPNTVAFSPRPGCIGNDNPFDLVNNNFSHTVNLKRDHFVLSIEEQIHHKLAEGCSSIR